MEVQKNSDTFIHQYAEPIAHTISSAVEIIAAVLIGIAVLVALRNYALMFLKSATVSQRDIRIQFGSSVAVALELLLGADVIATAVAPTWDDIGKLACYRHYPNCFKFFPGERFAVGGPVEELGLLYSLKYRYNLCQQDGCVKYYKHLFKIALNLNHSSKSYSFELSFVECGKEHLPERSLEIRWEARMCM